MPTGKDKWLSREEFFFELSKAANYIDEELAKKVYYAMVKMIVKECRSKGGVRLPDLGDFTFSWRQDKGLIDVNTHLYRKIPPQRTIKFSLDYKLRAFLKNLSERLSGF